MRNVSMVLMVLGLCGPVASQDATRGGSQTCVEARGKTACGYNCVEGYGEVRCAQTPAGVCLARQGGVRCWDPVREVGHAPGAPQAECQTAGGQVACGYHCRSQFGQLLCAQTPAGVVHVQARKLVRWDPPSWVAAQGAAPAECRAFGDQWACGYECTVAFGQLQCAQTPYGTCHARHGALQCWDPPAPVRGERLDEKATCLTRAGQTACGYSCQAGGGDVGCAARPTGQCLANRRGVVCTDG